MPTPSPARTALLATDRWSWLPAFTDRWYAEPLRPGDGSTPAEIEAAAARVGRALPVALAEWFTVVGRRLEPDPDEFATPAGLSTSRIASLGDAITVAVDHGRWRIAVDPDGTADDPVCGVAVPEDEEEEDGYVFQPAPLSVVLRGLVLAYTVTCAGCGEHNGPLGRFAPGVRGGEAGALSQVERAALLGAYAPLPGPASVHPDDDGAAPVGDADTVVRMGRTAWWMTRGDEAYARFDTLVPIEPAGGAYEAVLVFEGAAPSHPVLADGLAVPVTGEWLEMRATKARVWFTYATEDPVVAAKELVAAVPAELAPYALVLVRPQRSGTYRVAHPAERAGPYALYA